MATRGAGEGDAGEDVAARGVDDEGVEAARGTGVVAALGVGGCSTGAGSSFGSEVLGTPWEAPEAPAAAVAPEVVPAGKNLCGGQIGASTTSESSRNSKVALVEGPSRSAKGKAVSSKMTCLEMIILLEERSRQRYPLW